MKKKTRKIIIAAVVVVVAAAAIITYTTVSASSGQTAKLDTAFGTDAATKGDISLTVTGSGNLASAKVLNVAADSHIDIGEVLISTGDSLQSGQAIATVDTEAMQDYADGLQEQIDSTLTQIDTTNNVTTRLSIKSPADGWVKSIVLDEDDNIEDAMNEHGYIALVATEKREIINASGSILKEGDTVKVKCQNYTYTGAVTNENGTLYVSIGTLARKVGADAVVYDVNGNELFTGKIELAAYKKVESSYGTITDVKFSENEEIEAGETIYSAEQYSQDVASLYDTVHDLEDELATVNALIKAGQITAPTSGVVETLNINDDQSYDEGAPILGLESTDNLIATVSVDELDINSIKIGQSVNVTFDSLPNEEYKGNVTRISDLGSASGGITTYDVEVAIESNENFKLGMSVSCEITAQEAKDAVLVPVDDVITANSKSYVMAAVDRTDAEKAAIKQLITEKDYSGLQEYMGEDAATLGIRMLADPTQLLYAEVRAVETGIENAYYIEIKSGLAEGDKVLSQSTDSESSDRGFMMGGFGMMGGEVRQFEGRTNNQGGPGGSFPGNN